MAKPEFDIKIGKDGKVVAEVKGSGGKRCLELADLLREILGKEESRQLTSEYYGGQGQVKIDAQQQQQGRVQKQ